MREESEGSIEPLPLTAIHIRISALLFAREFNGDVHRTVCWSTDRYVVGALSVVTTIL